jgi:hypothetical protein
MWCEIYTTQHVFFRELNSTIFNWFWVADHDCVLGFFPARQNFEIIGLLSSIRQKRPLVQYIRAHILEANFFWGFWLSLCYWSYCYVQKIIRQDPSAASSFGEIFNLKDLQSKRPYHFHKKWPTFKSPTKGSRLNQGRAIWVFRVCSTHPLKIRKCNIFFLFFFFSFKFDFCGYYFCPYYGVCLFNPFRIGLQNLWGIKCELPKFINKIFMCA